MKRGKRYQEAAKLRDKTNLYDAPEAVAIVKKAASAKFDETIEAHFKIGLDGRHADQQIRGAVVLPNGTGKSKKILVIATGSLHSPTLTNQSSSIPGIAHAISLEVLS